MVRNSAALQWFKTYLKDRSTLVMINNVISQQHILNYSVPQGSIVGPQGFIMYTHPVGDIIRAHNICFHTYADDTKLFCDFNPKIPGDCEKALGVLTSCVSEINTWMCQNMLQLNLEKTTFIVIATYLKHVNKLAWDTCEAWRCFHSCIYYYWCLHISGQIVLFAGVSIFTSEICGA